jgi:hypothetical protein
MADVLFQIWGIRAIPGARGTRISEQRVGARDALNADFPALFAKPADRSNCFVGATKRAPAARLRANVRVQVRSHMCTQHRQRVQLQISRLQIQPLLRDGFERLSLRQLLRLPLRRWIDALHYQRACLVSLLPRTLQRHIRIRPERNQFLFTAEVVPQSPVTTTALVDNQIQPALIENLARLVLRLGLANPRIAELRHRVLSKKVRNTPMAASRSVFRCSRTAWDDDSQE